MWWKSRAQVEWAMKASAAHAGAHVQLGAVNADTKTTMVLWVEFAPTVANPIAISVPKAEISAALPFAVQSSAAVATITGASLADTPASNGDYLLTLTGTGFLPDSTVQVYGGNGSLTTEYVSPYQISAVLTASDYLLLPAMVTVKNPSGISAGFEVQ